jgi:hypothetical protein
MNAKQSLAPVVAACLLLGAGLLAGGAPVSIAQAQEAEAAQPAYSKGFLKAAGKVQKLVQEEKWGEALVAIDELEQVKDLNEDDYSVIFSWKLQSLRGVGDEAALNAFLEEYLASGRARPAQVGPIHQQLAAWYNRQKDADKTRFHYGKFIEATPDASAQEYETLGRLYFQAGEHAPAVQWLGKATETAVAAGEQPRELWFQLRDQSFVELGRRCRSDRQSGSPGQAVPQGRILLTRARPVCGRQQRRPGPDAARLPAGCQRHRARDRRAVPQLR